MKLTIRMLVALLMIGAMTLAGLGTLHVAAQDEEGFSTSVGATKCPEEYAGPFVGCEPWIGAEISIVSNDGAVNETCVTPDAPADARVSSCTYVAPFGSTITARLLSDPPDGWWLSSRAEQMVEIPDAPPDGVFGGATFVLQPEDESADSPPVSEGGTGEDESDVTELPATGRGSVATAADTKQIVTEQIVQTVMVLAAVVSVAFGSLALYARQRDL